MIFVWFLMLAFQGEGLDLDVQRRRYPMWEWLMSHPAQPRAVFFAEMLTPFIVNLFYWGAPIFWMVLFLQFFPFATSLLAGIVVGFAMAFSASCLYKMFETWVLLRCAPRSRGAVLGFASWIGYVLMIAPILFVSSKNGAMISAFVNAISPIFAKLNSSWLAIFFGGFPAKNLVLATTLTIIVWLMIAALFTIFAVMLSGRATEQGIGGSFGGVIKSGGILSVKRNGLFARNPLFRKELLWFMRDRGALVQAILIPLTISGYQIWNLRGLAATAAGKWNSLCGIAVFFGTYFLFILGPRSLLSEGQALWLAQTWPNGLEGLLKAKARLWSWLADGVVFLILLFSAIHFPLDAWKTALVTIGWAFFSRRSRRNICFAACSFVRWIASGAAGARFGAARFFSRCIIRRSRGFLSRCWAH